MPYSRHKTVLSWQCSFHTEIDLCRSLGRSPVLADAGYGSDTKFRDGITQLGLVYVMGIQSSVTVWPPG
jgi:hypothetical protein